MRKKIEHFVNKTAVAGSSVLGWLYQAWQNQAESWRIRRFRREDQLLSFKLLFQIWGNSKGILVVFAALIILLYLCRHVDILHSFVAPEIKEIRSFLGVVITSVAALLGLIFALYAVGFQISTEKYSENVTKYIDGERIGRSFFQLLILSFFIPVAVLFYAQFLNSIPTIALFVIIFLLLSSFLGILLFKDHYLSSLKPKSIFYRLLSEAYACVDAVSDPGSAYYRSWSIARNQQQRLSKLLDLIKALYDDLIRAGNQQDAQHAIVVMGLLLQYYTSRKKFIDKSRAWWFPQKYERVKATNLTLYELKFHFEMRGNGPLHLTSSNFTWVEDQIIHFLASNVDTLDGKKDELLLNCTVEIVQTVIAGSVGKDSYGRNVRIASGAWHNQEFYTFDKLFDVFLKFPEKIDLSSDLLSTSYLNSFFAVLIHITESGSLEQYSKYLKELPSFTEREIFSLNIPTFIKETLVDYRQRIEVEEFVEGKVITPCNWLEKEVQEKIEGEIKRRTEAAIKLGFNRLQKLTNFYVNKKNVEMSFSYSEIEWTLINRLGTAGYGKLAVEISDQILKDTALLLNGEGSDLSRVLELKQRIEYVLFPALLRGEKTLFYNTAKAHTIAHYYSRPQPDKIMALEEWLRVPLIIGSMCFIVSELRRDNEVLEEYVKILESLLWKPEPMVGVLRLVKKQPLGLIAIETTKYANWFSELIREIQDIPKKFVSRGIHIGGEYVADHPSKFISENSGDRGGFFIEDRAANEFVKWLEKKHGLEIAIGGDHEDDE